MPCSVCLDDFAEAGEASSRAPHALRCGHIFHGECLSLWLQSTKEGVPLVCPQCKAGVANREEAVRLYPADACDLDVYLRQRATLRSAPGSDDPQAVERGELPQAVDETLLHALLDFQRMLQAYVMSVHGLRLLALRSAGTKVMQFVQQAQAVPTELAEDLGTSLSRLADAVQALVGVRDEMQQAASRHEAMLGKYVRKRARLAARSDALAAQVAALEAEREHHAQTRAELGRIERALAAQARQLDQQRDQLIEAQSAWRSGQPAKAVSLLPAAPQLSTPLIDAEREAMERERSSWARERSSLKQERDEALARAEQASARASQAETLVSQLQRQLDEGKGGRPPPASSPTAAPIDSLVRTGNEDDDVAAIIAMALGGPVQTDGAPRTLQKDHSFAAGLISPAPPATPRATASRNAVPPAKAPTPAPRPATPTQASPGPVRTPAGSRHRPSPAQTPGSASRTTKRAWASPYSAFTHNGLSPRRERKRKGPPTPTGAPLTLTAGRRPAARLAGESETPLGSARAGLASEQDLATAEAADEGVRLVPRSPRTAPVPRGDRSLAERVRVHARAEGAPPVEAPTAPTALRTNAPAASVRTQRADERSEMQRLMANALAGTVVTAAKRRR